MLECMNLFSYVKDQLPILDVISQYALLKRAGMYWKGPCPFHNEKTASFTVSPHKNIFYCFGCHIGGDLITFITKIENCTPIEAVHHLAERHNLTLPETIDHDKNRVTVQQKKQYYELCSLVAQWCHEQLKRNPFVIQYLKQRSITSATIDYFGIGYFPGGLNSIKYFIADMNKHSILMNDLVEAHILTEGKTVTYSPFEDRIIFPIQDHLGRLCGFGGRIIKPSDTRAKYYNSRENNYFNKGSVLFGFDKAKKSIQETGVVFLVEGYTDCLTMVQYGYKNCVATLGTACTIEHLHILARHAEKLIVMYDGDNAGQQAIMRLTELCWQVSIELSVVTLPPKDDPASYLSSGRDLKSLIFQAKDIFTFFIDSLGTDFEQKSLSHKLHVTKKLIDMIKKIDEPIKQDLLLHSAAKTLDLPFDSLKQELMREVKRNHIQEEHKNRHLEAQSHSNSPDISTDHATGHEQEPSPMAAPDILEKKLFSAIINNIPLVNNEHLASLIEYLPASLSMLLKKLLSIKQYQPSISLAHFFDSLDQKEQTYVSKLLLEQEEDFSAQALEQLLLQWQKKNWKTIVHTIKSQLEIAKKQNNHEQVGILMNNFLLLKKKIICT